MEKKYYWDTFHYHFYKETFKMSLLMWPLELAGSTNDRKKQGKQEHKYKSLPSVYIFTITVFSWEQIQSFTQRPYCLWQNIWWVIQCNKFMSVSLVNLERFFFFVSAFIGFFLTNSHLIGLILTEQKHFTKSSCILLVYISYTIFNLNFEVVMSLWLKKVGKKP